MKDQPQGSVFGGYGFMRYSASHVTHRPSQPAGSTSPSASGIAAMAQRLLNRWTRR